MISNKRALGIFFATAFLLGDAVPAAEWQLENIAKIFAVADIHGANGAFERILKQAGVIDESLVWSGGDAHLVIAGDVLDRGAESRRAMDLIMRLEAEAAADGGGVHLVLGNHELMNLTGDLRYVSQGEYTAFADEEPVEIREEAFARFLAQYKEPLDEAGARAQFNQEFPLGFFAHRAAFASDGTYGVWLLSRPLLMVVNDTAFLHGGLSEAVIDLGGEGVNTTLAQQVRDYVDALEQLTAAGVLRPEYNFYDHTQVLDAFDERVALGEASWPEGLSSAAGRLRELNGAMVFGPAGPAWYRGTVGCSVLIERDRLMSALEVLGAARVVIGHTPTPDARILSRMDETVLRIDTGMLEEYYGGRAAALIIEGPDISVIYENENSAAEPTIQPRRVGLRPAGLDAADLEAFLSNADVVSRTEIDEQTTRVTLKRGDLELEAVFTPAARSSFLPEVATYRLDRLIGLDMVPVTVARELDRDVGSLQFSPGRVITETQRSTQGVGGSAWCPLVDQFPAMYAFDSLIYNEGRTPDRIRYSLEDFQLMLVGHDNALSTRRGRPAHLEPIPLQLNPAWRRALMSLNEELLTETLGDVLDRRRIRALLQRRDELLAPD